MAVPTQRFKMRSVVLSCLLSILLLSTTLNSHRDIGCGGIPVVFANPAVTTTIARGIILSGNRSINTSITTYHASGTISSDNGDGKGRTTSCRFVNDGGDCSHASHTSSSLSLCLQPLTARSRFYLRILYRRRNWEEDNEYDDDEKDFNYRYINFCWESIRDTEKKMTLQSSLKCGTIHSSSKPENDTTVAIVASVPSTIRLKRKNRNKNDKVRLQSLALKIDLLSATMKAQNNEILLPRSIADFFRQEKAATSANITREDVTSLPGTRSDPFLFSSTSPTLPQLQPIIEISSHADPQVDLTGRWRPATSISRQDLMDYDKFLIACCSDQISYWTRKLLTSSSIVSRQEFVVKQLDEERIVEFTDIHPLSSKVWNRNIVTSRNPWNSSGSRLGKNSPAMAREDDVRLDSYRSYVNQLKDPQGDPVLIEAYWQENGTVHTSLLRKVVNDNDGDGSATRGWLQTRRYLFSGKNYLETHKEDLEEKKRVMVVETTYYSTLFPTETESTFEAPSQSQNNIGIDDHGEDIVTRMVWKWEHVNKPSS